MGRGSANPTVTITITALVALSCLILGTRAADFTVGGASGWTFGVNTWPAGKTFKAGDVLVFNYDPKRHNVVVVDGSGLAGCKARPGSKTFTSGKDRVSLVKGQNNFICTFPQHCQSGMKISVNAL